MTTDQELDAILNTFAKALNPKPIGQNYLNEKWEEQEWLRRKRLPR